MPVLFSTLLALTLSTANAAEVSAGEPGHAFNPSWSPDGEWLAFEVNKYEGAVSLFVVKIQKGHPIGTPSRVDVPGSTSSFSTGGSMAAAPTWHPQGMMIFEGSNAGGTNRLYFWMPGGQKASELLDVGQVGGDLSWPSVSPNGNTIAFVSDQTGNGDLYYWDRTTNQVTHAISSSFSIMAPRYNAAGDSMAYSRKNNGGEDLFVWSNGESIPRIGGNGDQSRPIWVGDGMVFFSNERGEDHWDIARSNAPGDKTVIARDIRLPLRATPALSPDGQWVAYGLSDPEKANRIMLAKVDGSNTIEVDTGMVAAGEPSMIKSEGRVYLAYTCLPAEQANWRQLHIIDISEHLQ